MLESVKPVYLFGVAIPFPHTNIESSNYVLLSGVLNSLSFFFKQGKRDDVVSVAPRVLSRLGDCAQAVQGNAQLRKAHIKLVRWLGMTFLPPRVNKWRYQRGGRSLEEALATSSTAQQVSVY